MNEKLREASKTSSESQTQKNRLKFVKDMKNVDESFCETVIFTDESKYNIHGPGGNRRVCMLPGEPSSDHHFGHVVKFGWRSVMFWAP